MRLNSAFVTVALLGTVLTSTAWAGKFANQFTEFELPPQWTCNLEGAEWVCQNADENKKRDAIIVLAAKLKGDQDSLDQYLACLKAVKSYTSIQGKPIKSEVQFAQLKNFNGQGWVESLHLDSEIPGFYTRYLATVKEDIGVLITFSVNKAKYKDYLKDFDSLTATLKVFRKQGGLNQNPATTPIGQIVTIPAEMQQGSVFTPVTGSDEPKKRKSSDNSLLYILVGAAVVGFILMKKRRG